MFNSYWEALEFELPPAGESPASGWHRWIDTSLDSPDDICEEASAPALTGATCRVQPRSIVVLVARLLNKGELGAMTKDLLNPKAGPSPMH
jgi:glycogen operon protein